VQYDAVEDAFREAIAGSPRVVEIGEAHAQKGTTVASSARRFTDTLLPLLQDHASDLLVELMNPPTGCAAKVEDVKKKQAVVTAKQAETDQGEYVAMGERARRLGIVPDLLRPTCADMEAIRDAGADAIPASLITIARLTAAKVEDLVDRGARRASRSPTGEAGDADEIVVTYGGSIHNDRLPPAERAAWSFGPEVDGYVKGRYVEIDLYVPELIEDTEVWRKLPWFAYYDRAKMSAKATVFRPYQRSYVIIFPSSSGR
jgi:hypothetical protein